MNIPDAVTFFLDLEIDPTDNLKAIKAAYHKLAQKYHPDNQETGDPERFKKICHSYKMLTDASYRSKYVRSAGQLNLNAIITIMLDFEQAFFGDTFSITFSPAHYDENGKPVTIKKEDAHMEVGVFSVRIREGSIDEDRVTIKGKGLRQNDECGDLILILKVTPHPRFQLKGSDVYSTEQVELDTLLAGGEIEVLTMWGVRTLHIPPATLPETVLRIKKAGVAKVGDHMVRVSAKFPSEKDLKDKEIWKKLGINWEVLEEDAEKDEDPYERVFYTLGGFFK